MTQNDSHCPLLIYIGNSLAIYSFVSQSIGMNGEHTDWKQSITFSVQILFLERHTFCLRNAWEEALLACSDETILPHADECLFKESLSHTYKVTDLLVALHKEILQHTRETKPHLLPWQPIPLEHKCFKFFAFCGIMCHLHMIFLICRRLTASEDSLSILGGSSGPYFCSIGL